MKKSRLGLVCCLLIMLLLLGFAADGLASSQAKSAEHLRVFLSQIDVEDVAENSSQNSERSHNVMSVQAAEVAADVPTHSTEYALDDAQYGDAQYGDAPDESELGYLPYDRNLTEAERRGQQTWYFWTGADDKYFRQLAKTTHGEADFLNLLDARPDSELAPGDTHHLQRNERFKQIGVINDPECKAATQPDEYGLWLDQCNKDSHATGIMGLRKFKNPDFDPETWDVAAYYQPGEARAQIEPPYRMGITCGICHIAFNPLNPPNDPENPKWENIDGLIGNQYISEPALFGGNIPFEDFRAQVLMNQPRGTSDTSRLPTDHIDNPNSINGVFNLADRPKYEEVMNDGKTTKAVSHILKDGADSIGLDTISVRVYVNEGTCSDYWLTLHDPLLGRTPQRPFDIEKARRECEGWRQTEARMPDAAAYLKTNKPMHLEDAPGGKAYLTQDKLVLERGKIVFADTCAACHSSKQPPAEIATDPEQAKQWRRESVLSSDFLDHNFLSDDKRYPITLIGTNAARALATNATEGHIYSQFSSKTYKQLPSPGVLELANPFDEDKPIEFEVPAGGTGYYRTPSLISLWSSAPFLNNNMLGEYTGDPSVAGRMTAFNDAAEKLLWPEKRPGIIKRTDRDSHLKLGEFIAEAPKGTPIKLLANLDPRSTPKILQAKLNSPLGAKVLQSLVNFVPDQVLTPLLLKYNQAPDFIEDHGHEFGADLPDEDKQALIEFLKTF